MITLRFTHYIVVYVSFTPVFLLPITNTAEGYPLRNEWSSFIEWIGKYILSSVILSRRTEIFVRKTQTKTCLFLCPRNPGLQVWVLIYPHGCLFARLRIRGTDLISALCIFTSRTVTHWLTPVPAIHSEERVFSSVFRARPCMNETHRGN